MLAAGRLAHALLLRGMQGTGKTVFARRLAARVLCDQRDRTPCGECRGCTLLAAGSHPDHLELTPEEDRRTIGVDQVRALIGDLGLTARYAGYKVALVHPAESLTHAAANTMLKTLEEPPGATLIILVAHHSTRLPATIRSRCQMLDFHPSTAAVAIPWLEAQGIEAARAQEALRLAAGAPLLALELARSDALAQRRTLALDLLALAAHREDPLSVAERWAKLGQATLLTGIGALTVDLLRLKSGAPRSSVAHAQLVEPLHSLATGLDLLTIHRLLDEITALRRAQASQLNLNAQLALEGLAAHWWRAARSLPPGGRAAET
jgi:DNA polymerase-3 subunit delta'